MKKTFFFIIISHEPTYNSWPEVMTLVERVLHISIFLKHIVSLQKFNDLGMYTLLSSLLCEVI